MEAWKFVPLKTYETPKHPTPEKSIVDEIVIHVFDDALFTYGKFPLACTGLFGNAGLLLRAWAKSRGLQILEAPPVASLLNGSAEVWLQLHNSNNSILVIPSLERCFLRHYRGIKFVRQLVETAWENSCQLVIGCDVWAWKYLQQAVQIDALCPDALTAAPLMAYPAISDKTPDITPRAKNMRMQAYVLHTLLMHDGMSSSVLPQLLPFRATEVLKTLANLRQLQLAFEDDKIWRVAPEHYAGIRNQLAAVEFWVSDK